MEDGPDEDDKHDVQICNAAWQQQRRAASQWRRRRTLQQPLPTRAIQPTTTPARAAGPVHIVSRPRSQPPPQPRPSAAQAPAPLDPNNIKLLNAASFALVARQECVRVSHTTLGELETAAWQAKDNKQSSFFIPELTEGAFRDLLRGIHPAEHWKDILPEPCHDFIEHLAANPLRLVSNRINEEDAAQFFAKLDRPPLTDNEIRKKMPQEYHDLLHVARPQAAEQLPPHRSYDHKIELIPGAPLPYSRNRPMSPTELAVIKRWLDDNLVKGNLRPSSSSTAAPLLLARKPGGGVRICQDYRGVNNITIKNRYPLPLIRETLDAICNAKVYIKLDVIAAFNRVRIAEGHEWKTAFITRFGLYESLVTPFGLCGAPATFQRYINDVLYDILNDYTTAYLDDILIYSSDVKEHTAHVREVLQRLAKAGLQIDLAKCEFGVTRTKYLGLIITPGGIEMDPEKIKAIADWEPPTTRCQLQTFLGFANFYRRFIRDFSKHTKCLHDLTKKDATWLWTHECQAAFEALKVAFSSAPALRVYDWNRATVVEVDASNWSTGGTLLQYGDDGNLYPIAYLSAKHTAQECNYDIYDKELLAVIKALEEWRPELEGSRNTFEIVTDHKNLQTFGTTKQLTPRHMRWSELLSRFNFRIRYRPGTLNTMPEALSRKPEDMPQNETDDRLRARRRPLIDPTRFHPRLSQATPPAPQPMEGYLRRLHHTAPTLPPPGSHLSACCRGGGPPHENETLHGDRDTRIQRADGRLPRQSLQPSRLPRNHYLRPRQSIRLRPLARPVRTPGHHLATILRLPPPDQRPDREDQRWTREVPPRLHLVGSRRLGGLAASGRVCGQQHHLRDHRRQPLLRQLRLRPPHRRRARHAVPPRLFHTPESRVFQGHRDSQALQRRARPGHGSHARPRIGTKPTPTSRDPTPRNTAPKTWSCSTPATSPQAGRRRSWPHDGRAPSRS